MAPPYGTIARLLERGEVIPFLGAGVNFGARPPAQDPDERPLWDESTSAFLPSGAELSRLLADECGFTSRHAHDFDDLAKVASFYVESIARSRLRERLSEIFKPPDRVFEPCLIHRHLARVASRQPMVIVTTNYDDLTERALDDENVPYDLIVHPADHPGDAASVLWWQHGAGGPEAVPSNSLYINLERTTVVYKIHGTVDPRKGELGGYVISEEDYEEFLSTMISGQMVPPPLFMNHFRSRHFLFLGYSLRDWNLRVILRKLKNLLPVVAATPEQTGEHVRDQTRDRLKSWAIQFEPLDWEIELWKTRDIRIYDQDINSFVEQLRRPGPHSRGEAHGLDDTR